MVQELGTLPIKLFGCDEQQAARPARAARAASGRRVRAVRARGRLRPGRDAHHAPCSDGDEWVINGAKNWITNAGVADFYVVFAVTDRERTAASPRSSSRPTAPASRSASSSTSSASRARPPARRCSTDVRVPAENVIGEVGGGHARSRSARSSARASAPPPRRSGSRRARPTTPTRYAKERIAFGKPINELQGDPVQARRHGDRHRRRARAALQGLRAADRGDPQPPSTPRWPSCSPPTPRWRVTVEAVQVLGGYGYVTEYPVERMMRDAKITQIYEGTNEIQRRSSAAPERMPARSGLEVARARAQRCRTSVTARSARRCSGSVPKRASLRSRRLLGDLAPARR